MARVWTRPDYVEAEPWTDPATGKHAGWVVAPFWEDFDRPCVGGVLVLKDDAADALMEAMQDGSWFTKVELATDKDCKTYVSWTARTNSRYVRSELRKMGYLK